MELNILSGFEEFKNTTEGRKITNFGSEKEPQLKFRLVKTGNREDVIVVFNKPLLRSMKDNNVITFKLLFNEETKQVAVVYDNSSNAMSLVNRRTRDNGDIIIQDKFITATMIPLFKDKKLLIYDLKCNRDKIIYIFKRAS